MFDSNPEEHYLKEGDPSKPTYYIIRRMDEKTELFDMYLMVMGHIYYALSNGWIPVVDMQYYPNPYLDPEKLGKENAWEYYFEQPFHIGLDRVYAGDNVVLSNGDCVKPYPDYSINLLQKKNDKLVEWRMLIKLGLMNIKPERIKEFSAVREKFFLPDDIILGVLLRGDASDKKVKGQPIPPPAGFAINTISDKFEDWKCNKLLLATEDKSVVEMFKNSFGDKCVSLDQIYSLCYDTEEDSSEENKPSEDKDLYFLKGKKHLLQTIFLYKCNSFVSERCPDATVTMLLVKKFEHVHFFNLGSY